MNEIILENTLKLVWQFKDNTHYKISECRNIVNCKTGRKLKRTVIGTTVGYWIGHKFIPLKKINNYCEKIPIEKLPF